MRKKLKLIAIVMLSPLFAFAQNENAKDAETVAQKAGSLSESAFTFTEAQLGEDDDVSQNVTIVNSNSNVYASEVGFLFSPVRFRYRAFNQKYNEVYINGAPMNDMERGQFSYSLVGGLNNQTRNVEYSLPFSDNNFAMSAMGGSNNYNFRPGQMASGQRASVAVANRNYTLRGMYSYNSGFNDKGWAFSGALTYRWADEGYVEGTFYNSLSYFLGVQKLINNGKHSISFVTWGNPTERASQGAGTDETYWLANNRYYNPYWGYQNGKKRNSRIVNDFAPSALFTWDWNIDDNTKLTTSLFGKYAMYKSTKLNYNNTDNPHPNYWKNLPSSFFDVWYDNDPMFITDQCYEDWKTAYNYWTASKANRQINFDRLYYVNQHINTVGGDAMYYIQAKHNDQLNFTLSSTLNKQLTKNSSLFAGIVAATNRGMHYQTMEDLLGAEYFHNINTYAIGKYSPSSPEVQYDLNHPNARVGVGDKFGYDYNIYVNKGNLWASYVENFGILHYSLSGRIGYTSMQREGKMRNGLAADRSYGKSKTADFLDGGLKFNGNFNLGRGHRLILGLGYEQKAPLANAAFASPEINNDFVKNLRNEQVYSFETGYELTTSWLHASISGFYSYIANTTDWQNFYFDDVNSFTYVSLTGNNKAYYGAELGMKFKLASFLDFNLLGTISDARFTNNATARYMNSTSGEYTEETCYNKDMRENGTPLTAASAGVSFHKSGWFIDLNLNYYDRIYLSYSPSYRYQSTLDMREKSLQSYGKHVFDNDGNILPDALAQAKGHGGFMLDGSIGRSIYLKHGSLSVNLMVTNILNNQNIVTGGYEQSRSDYTNTGNARAYAFSRNPMKFYAYGTNGMLNLSYKF